MDIKKTETAGEHRWKKKLYMKARMDFNGNPYRVSQKRDVNSATLTDIENIIRKHPVDEDVIEEIMGDLKKYMKRYHIQLRVAGHPNFLEVSAGKEFYEQFKKEIKKISNATVRIHNADGVEKTGPLAFFTMYHYED